MGFFDLPTLGEVNAVRRAIPKGQIPTRLDEKTASDKDDAGQLAKWKKAVKARDKGRCRVCGVKTVVTLELDPKRGEAHHIVGRADKAVRYDVRNGVHVCLKDHQRFKRGLYIAGTAAQMFTAANGRQYLDATHTTLRFLERP